MNNNRRWVEKIWYDNSLFSLFLQPLAIIFSGIVWFRRFCYQAGFKKAHTLPVPVIVVGNITVGGTGKTPLVVWLAELLKNAGYKPGIISRGYGGQSPTWPRIVNEQSNVEHVGDEPLLIFQQTQLPVAVGPNRVDTAKKLLSKFDCNVIISDDGLQHYKLNRDIEIVVIDGMRRFGNGYMLPAGPLREPVTRLKTVDFIIVNGEKSAETEYSMSATAESAINMKTGEIKTLTDFKTIACHAIAGIGNPDRFFSMLAEKGLNFDSNPFPDHFKYQADNITFPDDKPVLMTEKDAVKCTRFAELQHWYIPIKAKLEPAFTNQILGRLHKLYDR